MFRIGAIHLEEWSKENEEKIIVHNIWATMLGYGDYGPDGFIRKLGT